MYTENKSGDYGRYIVSLKVVIVKFHQYHQYRNQRLFVGKHQRNHLQKIL